MNVTACSSCGRKIIWTFSPTGARLPLDARPVTIYAIEDADAQTPRAKKRVVVDAVSDLNAQGVRETKVYVSHFLTCLQPSQHSRVRAEADG